MTLRSHHDVYVHDELWETFMSRLHHLYDPTLTTRALDDGVEVALRVFLELSDSDVRGHLLRLTQAALIDASSDPEFAAAPA